MAKKQLDVMSRLLKFSLEKRRDVDIAHMQFSTADFCEQIAEIDIFVATCDQLKVVGLNCKCRLSWTHGLIKSPLLIPLAFIFCTATLRMRIFGTASLQIAG